MSEKIRLVFDRHDAKVAEDYLLQCVLIANDIETIPNLGLMDVNGYSGLHPSGEIQTFVFPYYNGMSPESGSPADLEEMMAVQARINASGIPFTYHNGPYDLFWLVRYAMPVANYAYDSMSMWWSAFPELPKTLAFVSSILLDDYVYWKGGRKGDYIERLMYNGRDCYRTLQNTIRLVGMLRSNHAMRQNWIDAHVRVINFLGLSLRGIKHDGVQLEKHAVTLRADAERELARLRYILADPEFNPQSSVQKSELFYTLLGARPRNAKGRFVKRKEDASTGAVPMRAMRGDHPIIRKVVEGITKAIEPAKQISNIVNMRVSRWDRFHTGYNGVGTTTTRAASSEAPIRVGGNAQNWRKDYRNILRADDGCFLLDIDFSAADDVFVSFESGDPRKIELFRSGRDTHSQNATLFFPDWNYDQVVAGKKAKDPKVVHPITGIRQITKKLSHGCNYLMAALTLLMTAGRDAIVAAAKEAGYPDAGIWTQDALVDFCESRERLYRNYYTRFRRSGIDSWYSELQDEARTTHGFTTAFGYFQRFLGDPDDDRVLRAVAATAGQANTAGRINWAMDELEQGWIRPAFRDAPNPSYGERPRRANRAEHGISLRLQSHDSLTWNVDPRHPGWEEGVDNIYTAMGRPVLIRNKLTGDMEEFRIGLESEVGPAWGPGLKECVRDSTGSANSLASVKATLSTLNLW